MIRRAIGNRAVCSRARDDVWERADLSGILTTQIKGPRLMYMCSGGGCVA